MKRHLLWIVPSLLAAMVVSIYWRDRSAMAERTRALEARLDAVLASQRQIAHAIAQRPAIASADRGASRGECATTETVPAGAETTSVAAEANAAQTLERQQVNRDAWAAVDAVLAKQSWTEDDRRQYGPLFRSLDTAERERVITTLLDAMNRREIAPSDVALL